MKNSDYRKENKKENIPLCVAVGSVAGVIIFFALTLIFALVSFESDIGTGLYFPSELLFGGVSGAAAGFVTVRPIKRLAAPLGACAGLCMSAVTALIMLIINGGASVKNILILSGVIILLAAIGGVAAANIKKKMRY